MFAALIAAASPARFTIPAGTVAGVQMTDSVDSGAAKSGDTFHFETADDTEVDGKVVIPKHTPGIGIVSLASSAGTRGKAGALVLEARYLLLPSGQKLQVTIDRRIADLSAKGQSTKVPWYAHYLPIPQFGLMLGAYDYVHHGRNITLGKGTIFAVFSIEEVTVGEPLPRRAQSAALSGAR